MLCRRIERKFDSGSSFSYKGACYMISENGKTIATKSRSKVFVLESSSFGLKAKYGEKVYDILKLDIRPKKKKVISKPKPKSKYRPAASHPWKQGKLTAGEGNKRLDRDTYYALLGSRLAWRPDNYIE